MTDGSPLVDAELAARHAWLLRLARSLAADEASADDLAQEAWVRVLTRGTSAARDLRAYLGGVVRVLAASDRAVRRARSRREERAARAETLPSAAELAERLELARVLAEELARLPERTRTLLLLHHQEGVPLHAIAARRGLAASTVRAELARARARLRERLDRRFGGERGRWALVALTDARELAAAAAAGGMAMHVGWKVGLSVAVLALAGAWWTRKDGAARMPESAPETTPVAVTAPRITTGVAAREPLRGEGSVRANGTATGPAKAADLRVLLRDSRTGEPLPHYALRVRPADEPDDERGELVTSDAAGELVLAADRFELPVRLLALDDAKEPCLFRQERLVEASMRPPATRPTTMRAGGDEPLVLELLAGPTYALRFAGPVPEGDELRARLDASAGADPGDGHGFRARVRPGDLPWVRLDPESTSSLGEGPWTLLVRDRRGFWLAWGAVDQVVGAEVEPVVLETSPRGALAVALRSGGAPLDAEWFVSAFPLSDDVVDRGRGRSQRSANTHRGGRARLELLEPGEYRVSGGSRAATASCRATVLAGVLTEVAIDLPARPELSRLEVHARSRSGRTRTNAFGLSFEARGPDGADSVYRSRWVTAGSDGSSIHAFDALPPGEYEVELLPTPHLPPFESRVQRARPGGEPLVFTCLDEDAPPMVRARVRVLDAATGRPIPLAGMATYLEHRGHFLHATDEAGEAAIGPYPSGLELEVFARAAGHAATLVPWRVDADVAPLEIALEPGWGTLVEVQGLAAGPLEGVRVLLDGVHAATTDAHGRALVTAARRPRRMEFERAGWVLQGGHVDRETLAPSPGETHAFWIVLERAQEKPR